MTIEIPPDVEAGLCRLAREWGVTIEQATMAVLIDRVRTFIPPFQPRTDRDREIADLGTDRCQNHLTNEQLGREAMYD